MFKFKVGNVTKSRNINLFEQKIKNKSVLFLSKDTLTAREDIRLRSLAKKNSLTVTMIKNSLVKLVFRGAENSNLLDSLQREHLLMLGEDEAQLFAFVSSIPKDLSKKLSAKCIVSYNRGFYTVYQDEKLFKTLSRFKSKEGLVSGIVGALKRNISQLAHILNLIVQKTPIKDSIAAEVIVASAL